jgi:SOS-response transcriptional repressor LexA
MNEKTRPSKKQRELLSFIDGFIKGNGYGPSYREIMRALDYKSVSTVAVHVDGLIAKGLLRKTDNAARTLELVSQTIQQNPDDEHIRWLKREIKKRQAVQTKQTEKELPILARALDILLDQTDD